MMPEPTAEDRARAEQLVPMRWRTVTFRDIATDETMDATLLREEIAEAFAAERQAREQAERLVGAMRAAAPDRHWLDMIVTQGCEYWFGGHELIPWAEHWLELLADPTAARLGAVRRS